MAGIGFKLRSIMQKGTYSAQFAAYAYGAVISTGPWLISIISIGILNYLCQTVLQEQERILFRTILVYTYMGSLVFTGPFYMATTRYLADRMYSNDYPAILPTFKYVSRLALLSTTLLRGYILFLCGAEGDSRSGGGHTLSKCYSDLDRYDLSLRCQGLLRNYQSIY